MKFQFKPNDYQKAECSMYILHKLLPFLKCLNEEQTREREIEARMNGILCLSFHLYYGKTVLIYIFLYFILFDRMYCIGGAGEQEKI